jgi:Glucose dehydrogenase
VITTPTRACPGVLGGTEWNGPAYNPGTNMLYVPAVDWCATFTAYEQVRFIPGKGYMGGRTDLDPPDKAQGWLTAIDATSGAVKWKYRSPRPMVAAVTTTAGNVVMTGELTGDFTIFDAKTVRTLPIQHRRSDRRRHRDLRGRRQAVHRRRGRQSVELLGRSQSRRADDHRVRIAWNPGEMTS